MHSIEMIAVSALTIDPVVQRSLDEVRVVRMSKVFDKSAVGTFVVSLRGDGTMVVLDGQHRRAAAILAGMPDLKVPCDVRRGLTIAEEAELFRRLNTTRRLTQSVDHAKGVLAGDPEALGIEETLQKFGWSIGQGNGREGVILAIDAVRQSYRGLRIDSEKGPQAFHDALETITRAFGHEPDAVRREVLIGMTRFWLIYRGFDPQALVSRLENAGLKTFRRDVDKHHQYPTRLDEAVTAAIVARYNGRRRSKNIARLIDRRSDAA